METCYNNQNRTQASGLGGPSFFIVNFRILNGKVPLEGKNFAPAIVIYHKLGLVNINTFPFLVRHQLLSLVSTGGLMDFIQLNTSYWKRKRSNFSRDFFWE